MTGKEGVKEAVRQITRKKQAAETDLTRRESKAAGEGAGTQGRAEGEVWQQRCRGGSLVKSTHCSCKRQELSPQHPHGAAHNHLQLHFQGIRHPLLASVGACASPT